MSHLRWPTICLNHSRLGGSILKIKLLACSFVIAACSLLAQRASGPLTNQKIGDLAVAGVSESEIIRLIGAAQTVNFDLRPGSTDNLLSAGVSEEIIKAMAARQNGSVVAPMVHEARQRLTGSSLSLEPTGKPRVFVQDSNDSWSFTSSRHFGQGSTHPQTVEVIKTFSESCPGVTVTNDPQKADYKVEFERESSKLARRHNKFAAFNRAGDLVYADSTRALDNAVRGFCSSIRQTESSPAQN
jgi:hypothetical protein